MGSEGEQRTIALGNRLKELRNKHNLTISGLAEILGVSHSYVGLLEKGTRKGSEEILRKYADFFRVPLNELVELQKQLIDPKQIVHINVNQPSDKIVEFNVLLTKLNEGMQSSLIEQFIEQIQKALYSLLIPYDLSDVKRMATKIKSTWFSEAGHIEEGLFQQRGYINMPSGQIYFDLKLEEGVVHTQILYEDRKQVSIFEKWLGVCSVSYSSAENIAHIQEPQKVLNILWFSPKLSYHEQYQFLYNRELVSFELNYSDPKLEWFVHNYHQYDSNSNIR